MYQVLLNFLVQTASVTFSLPVDLSNLQLMEAVKHIEDVHHAAVTNWSYGCVVVVLIRLLNCLHFN